MNSTDGITIFRTEGKLDIAEMSAWEPARITAFFDGLALTMRAINGAGWSESDKGVKHMADEKRIERAKKWLTENTFVNTHLQDPKYMADFAESELARTDADILPHQIPVEIKVGLKEIQGYLDSELRKISDRLCVPSLPTNPDARAIAEKIADELFTDADGNMANVLNHYQDDKSLGYGWDKIEAQKATERILSAELSRWIPVGERLPEKDWRYVVTVFNPDTNEFETRIDSFVNGRWYGLGKHVTHWQSLPEPAEGEAVTIYKHQSVGSSEDVAAEVSE